MIFLDANMFLRFLVQPADPVLQQQAAIAKAIFAEVSRGDQEVTTTEVVLHEVAFVLASKHHYALAPATIAHLLGSILRVPGFRLPAEEIDIYLRALDLYAAHRSSALPMRSWRPA